MKLVPKKPVNPNDNLGRGIDMALVTLVFLGAGFVLDRVLGTRPLFMVALVLLALIGQFVRMRYEYEATMKTLEAQRQQKRDGQGVR